MNPYQSPPAGSLPAQPPPPRDVPRRADLIVWGLAAALLSTEYLPYPLRPRWHLGDLSLYNPCVPIAFLIMIGWITASVMRGRWRVVLLALASTYIYLRVSLHLSHLWR